MVPFIDVVLVLLIIFMITAPILQSGIDVDVPKTKTVKELTEVRMVVTIDRGQRVYLNDKPVNIHEIGQKVVVAIARSEAPVGIRAVRRNGAVRKLGDRGGRFCGKPASKYQRGDATAQRAPANTMKWQPSPQSDRTARSSDSLCLHRIALHLGGLDRGARRYLPAIDDDWGGPGGSVTVGRGRQRSGDSAASARMSNRRIAWWITRRDYFKPSPSQCQSPSPTRRRYPNSNADQAAKIRYETFEGSRESHAAAAECDSLRRRRHATVPRTSFAMGSGNTQASLGFTGTAGGDFGSRFSWYVEAVQRRVSGNWLQSRWIPA